MLTLEEAVSTVEHVPELPSVDSFINILQRCRNEQNAVCASRVHMLIHNSGLEINTAIGNHLVPVLVDCGYVPSAQQVFYRLPHRNEHCWTSLIQGYSDCKETSQYAFDLFERMQEDSVEPTSYTYLAIIKVCMILKSASAGQRLHDKVVREGLEREPYVGSALVELYAQFGSLGEAHSVFDELVVRDCVLWTFLITHYVEHGYAEEALCCFKEMQLSGVVMDAVTYVCVLKACGSIGAMDKGHEIHAAIIHEGLDAGLLVGNSLLDMHCKCGCYLEAWEVLEDMPLRDTVSWNTLIASYSENGLGEEVLTCLERMKMEGVPPSAATFISSVQAFGSMRDGDLVQALHMEVTKVGFEGDLLVCNCLVDAYAKCGSLAEAQEVFDSLPHRNVITWTALLAGLVEHGLHDQVLDWWGRMQQEDVLVDEVTLVCILKACSSIGALELGLELHAYVVEEGFEKDPMVGNTLVDMYAKCSYLEEAKDSFDSLHVRSVVSWNALLAGYAEVGMVDEALECLDKLTSEMILVNDVTYVYIFQGCGGVRALGSGQGIHIEVTKKALDNEMLVGGSLVDFYAKCGAVAEACHVLGRLPEQNVIPWAALLAGHVEYGLCEEALECMEEMRLKGVSPNALTYVYCLKACGKMNAIDVGKVLHDEIVVKGYDRDQVVGNALLSMYGVCGMITEAQDMLDALPARDVVSWNALITGYAEQGLNDVVMERFYQMRCEGVLPDSITHICCLKACGQMGSLGCGQGLHSEIVRDSLEGDATVGSALVEMYGKLGSFEEMEEVFVELGRENIATWNALLLGYNEHGLAQEVLMHLEDLQSFGISANAGTYTCCLRACGMIGAVRKGQLLHSELVGEGYDTEPSVVHALVDMYSKCAAFEEAQDIVEGDPDQDTMLWNALLSGYTKHGYGEGTLNLLEEMHSKGVPLDLVTCIGGLKACADVGAVDKGCDLHMTIIMEEFENQSFIGNTVLDMYVKCGLLVEAQDVFDDLPVRDVVSWSALISGYAGQGCCACVFHLLQRMIGEAIELDEVAVLRVLTACSHAGLVDKGQMYFQSFIEEYSITVTIEQCNCIMDLLSRAGQLDKAFAMVDKIPYPLDMVTWTTMLGACKKWGVLELGRQAFEGATKLEMEEAASLILLSDIYAGLPRGA